MHHRRRNLFTSLCALSLLLAAAVAFLWVKTFDDRWRLFGISRDEEKYSLISEAGQLVSVGPPGEGEVESPGGEPAWAKSNSGLQGGELRSAKFGGGMRAGRPR